MAGIGGVTCDFVRGASRGLKERVDTWEVPGIDGYGAQLLGGGNAEYRFLGVKLGTSAEIETWVGQIEDLQGQIISVVDDWPVTHTNLLVKGIGAPRKTPAVQPGTSNVARCEMIVQGVMVQ